MTKEEIAKRFCKFELCTHRNGEGMCCLFNQDNCIFHKLERENHLLGERCNQLLKDKGNLIDELKEWKDEWQEQVQKAIDEGWERTKLTGRVRELEQENNKLLDIINNQDVKIADLEQKLEQTEKDLADYQFNYPTIKKLEKENAELKSELTKKADTNHSLVEQMAKLESDFRICEHNADTYYDQLTKATEIINALIALHYNPVVTKDDLKKQDKILEQAEQFLKKVK
ncbi:MAG: hypothetical protein J6W16_06735 [Methanobrevibacter sp.]|nr:hypothetical protein [Methanobrevibacter sp.]MBP5785259.1 hypothetical protein [Methanobrevibacter sp.]